MKQFQSNKEFENRSEKVVSARTYFYEDEHKCDVHLETFLKCIDAVGKHVLMLKVIYSTLELILLVTVPEN